MIKKKTQTHQVLIYIAGDSQTAKQACREFCLSEGLCVTVSECAYIYAGGEEAGVIVGLLNYPRFPTTHYKLKEKAVRLAEALRVRLCQHSFLIADSRETTWTTYHPNK